MMSSTERKRGDPYNKKSERRLKNALHFDRKWEVLYIPHRHTLAKLMHTSACTPDAGKRTNTMQTKIMHLSDQLTNFKHHTREPWKRPKYRHMNRSSYAKHTSFNAKQVHTLLMLIWTKWKPHLSNRIKKMEEFPITEQ